jgi:hypothetical protein
MIGNHSINAQTLLQNHTAITTNLKPECLSLNRISDSRLQLQQIETVLVTLKSRNANFSLAHCSIECIKAKISHNQAVAEPLFQNASISNYHYRQCILDPLLFNVVNKQIVSLISSPAVHQKLRIRAIQFLTTIVKKDSRVLALVLREVDFAALL